MLYDHDKWGSLPIGIWENIRVENGTLLADPKFDLEDEKAKEISRKVDQGFIRGCSMGLAIEEWSRDENEIKEGQTRPTLSKSKLMEVSITPFPSNGNALKLTQDGRQLNLSAGVEIENSLPKFKFDSKMKTVALKLGLPEDATEQRIVESIVALQNEHKVTSEQLAATFVKLGEATGTITDENRERMTKLAETDFELALSFLTPAANAETEGSEPDHGKNEPETLRLSDLIKELKKNQANSNDPARDYDWYQKNDPDALALMQKEQPEEFMKLYNDYVNQKNV